LPKGYIVKPGRYDVQLKLRISGDELRELKRHTYLMAAAYGLDRRIERYAGTRPLGLYRWDLDCLIDVIDIALKDKSEYPDKDSPEFSALERLGQRLRREYRAAYR
jgi:hypothetical protein